MQTKLRLERVLQILADVERVGSFSDIERDIVLNELREAYTEVRFADKVEPVAVAAPEAAAEAVAECSAEDEPEVEVELIFSEEGEETTETEPEAEPEATVEPVVVPPVVEPVVVPPVVEAEPIAEPEPIVAPEPVVAEEARTILSSGQGRSAILSLYDDEPKPVVGELFAEQPSVADVIARPKGVAEVAPVASLRGTIGVADRFMLIRELFDGNGDAYDKAIEALDAQPSFDDCVIYITEHFSWRAEREGTKYIMELLQRKFH